MSLAIDDALGWAAKRNNAVVITTKSDGSPQSSDVTYSVDDGVLVVSTADDRAKAINIRRDPRIIIHVSSPAEWAYVAFYGTAELSNVCTNADDQIADALLEQFERVTGSPHADPERYRSLMVSEARLLVTLKPTRAVGHYPGSD